MDRNIDRARMALFICALLTFCSGGCTAKGSLTDIPGVFPDSHSIADGIQLRVTESGLRSMSEQAETLIGALIPQGLNFRVPSGCDQDIEVCCDAPPGTCGMVVDITRQPGDLPRLDLKTLAVPGNPLEATMRMRVRTAPGPLLVELGSSDCEIHINTENDDDESLSVSSLFRIERDPLTESARISIDSIAVDGLDRGDIDIDGGGFLCGLADTFKGIALDIIRDQIAEHAAGMVEQELCKPCQSDGQCGPRGSCSDRSICMISDADGARCVQELGVAGRMVAATVHPTLSEPALIDLELLASGQTDAATGGVSLGLSAGAKAGMNGFLTCGPESPPPSIPDQPVPTMTQLHRIGAELDGLDEFDIAFGVHKAFLDRASWAAYQSGLLCITVDTSMVSVLNSDALSALFPSIGDLLPDGPAPLAVRLRPQAPPTFALGAGSLVEVHMSDLDVDIFMMVDENLVRLFTARTALTVPMDIETDASGALIPTVGDIGRSFTDIAVDSPGILDESVDEIAGKFPAMGSLVSGLVNDVLSSDILGSGVFGPIQLPSLPGVALRVLPSGTRSLDGNQLLGIFARFEPLPDSQQSTTNQQSSANQQSQLDTGPDSSTFTELFAGCRTSSGTASPWPLVLAIPILVFCGRRRRVAGRARRIAGSLAGLVLFTIPLASCSALLGEDRTTQETVIGRFSDIAVDRDQILISAYEQRHGDLVVGRVSGAKSLDSSAIDSKTFDFRPIDGVPAGAPKDPSAYRGGIREPGDDVGGWTSIAITGGRGSIAYHDRSGKRLKFAREVDTSWHVHVVDQVAGAVVGRYVSLAVNDQGVPGIAYMAHSIANQSGGLLAQLRWAQATSPAPTSAADWTIDIIAESTITESQSPVAELPAGTGLYPSAGYLPDGRIAVAFYDRNRGDLRLATGGTGAWNVVALDSDQSTDTGQWTSLAIDASGTIHVAYREATKGHLRYLTYRGGVVGVIETIDSGVRDNAAHPVGAHAALVLDPGGRPTVVYQDQFDISVLRAERDDSGRWIRGQVKGGRGDVLRGGSFIAAARLGSKIWISSFAYDRKLHPPGTLSITSIAR
ncbi:MAG: hypothetical protein MJE77_13370 [Proteobacteria bacterium]|nr:hypothetical protein [Pseudomonadota bacterium]